MSLYSENAPEQDAYQALAVALGKTAETREQVEALLITSNLLEKKPTGVIEICLPLFEAIKNTGDSALKRWVLDRIAFGLGRSELPHQSKTTIASSVLADMVNLLQDPSPAIVKLAVQSLSSIYPLLFRALCLARPPQEQQWQLLRNAKTQIMAFALAISLDPATLGNPKEINLGVRSLSWKFIQRTLLVATRGGSADPRKQVQNENDPNLNLVPAEHPFIKSVELMTETNQLLAQISQALSTNSEPAILHPILNMVPPLLKARPALATNLIPAIAAWTPAAMITANKSASQVRAVEKGLKVVMHHLLRTGMFPAFGAQLNDSLQKQTVRTSAAIKLEKISRQEAAVRRAQQSSVYVKREHELVTPAISDGQPSAAKKQKTEVPAPQAAHIPGEGLGPDVDVTKLGFDLMLDLLFASLDSVDERSIRQLAEQTRHRLRGTDAVHHLALAQSLGPPQTAPIASTSQAMTEAMRNTAVALPSRLQEDEPDDMLLDPLDEDSAIPSGAALGVGLGEVGKLEDGPPENPLEMLVEEEEPEDAPNITIPDEVAMTQQQEEILPVTYVEFSLPEVESLDRDARHQVVLQIIQRICQTGGEIQQQMANDTDIRMLDEDSEAVTGIAGPMVSPKEMWILLLARMASRSTDDTLVKNEDGTSSGDDWIRQTLCDHIIEDFTTRSRLARVWLNEEWYSSRLKGQDSNASSAYSKWTRILLTHYLEKVEDVESSDNSLSSFLIDLPDVPREVLEILRGLCERSSTTIVGISTLRDIVTLRPPLRSSAMTLLLDMTTHPDRKIRLVAINTVKRWVPENQAMSGMVLAFAKQTFGKLTQDRAASNDTKTSFSDYSYLPNNITLPLSQEVIQQYVELLFALSVREPQLLGEIFITFTRCDESIQTALKAIATPLIRSLGSNHAKLLELLQSFSPESEPFALHVLTVLTESARPSASLVSVVKQLAEERDLPARFLIPIAAQMSRAELYRFLPHILGILSKNPVENRETIRNVFRNIIPIPDVHASTNLPKTKPEELSAADLLVLLHEQEKSIGVSAAKEAIDICFTLTDRFPSEVLAVVMQRIIDSVSLPILFMRTVIRSVQTYKSLVGYVSTTLLSRLITKKIWTIPQLWLGFMHCVKAIAPASFGALMQLPREQLKELIEKQPSIKPALYQYVVQKAGIAKAKSLEDVFGNGTPMAGVNQPISTVS